MSRSWSIRLATVADAQVLPGVERSAGELFGTLPQLAWIGDEPIASADEFLSFIAAGTVWLADDREAGVIGELRGEVVEDVLHIVELAVSRAFQQRGIGRALIDAAADWARACGLRALTLTTFRDVVWNAPFYARYGFVELAPAECDERLRALVAAEQSRGLLDRCAMRLALA